MGGKTILKVCIKQSGPYTIVIYFLSELVAFNLQLEVLRCRKNSSIITCQSNKCQIHISHLQPQKLVPFAPSYTLHRIVNLIKASHPINALIFVPFIPAASQKVTVNRQKFTFKWKPKSFRALYEVGEAFASAAASSTYFPCHFSLERTGMCVQPCIINQWDYTKRCSTIYGHKFMYSSSRTP